MNGWDMSSVYPFVQRLGWTLVHSMWEIVLIGLLYALTAASMRNRPASARYALGCVMLLAMIVTPTATFLVVEAGDAPSSIVVEAVETSQAKSSSGPARSACKNLTSKILRYRHVRGHPSIYGFQTRHGPGSGKPRSCLLSVLQGIGHSCRLPAIQREYPAHWRTACCAGPSPASHPGIRAGWWAGPVRQCR